MRGPLRDPVWHVVAKVSGAEAATAVFDLLYKAADAVSAFETAPEQWRVEAYPPASILTPALSARLALVAAAASGSLIEIIEEKLAPRDWLGLWCSSGLHLFGLPAVDVGWRSVVSRHQAARAGQ